VSMIGRLFRLILVTLLLSSLVASPVLPLASTMLAQAINSQSPSTQIQSIYIPNAAITASMIGHMMDDGTSVYKGDIDSYGLFHPYQVFSPIYYSNLPLFRSGCTAPDAFPYLVKDPLSHPIEYYPDNVVNDRRTPGTYVGGQAPGAEYEIQDRPKLIVPPPSSPWTVDKMSKTAPAELISGHYVGPGQPGTMGFDSLSSMSPPHPSDYYPDELATAITGLRSSYASGVLSWLSLAYLVFLYVNYAKDVSGGYLKYGSISPAPRYEHTVKGSTYIYIIDRNGNGRFDPGESIIQLQTGFTARIKDEEYKDKCIAEAVADPTRLTNERVGGLLVASDSSRVTTNSIVVDMSSSGNPIMFDAVIVAWSLTVRVIEEKGRKGPYVACGRVGAKDHRGEWVKFGGLPYDLAGETSGKWDPSTKLVSQHEDKAFSWSGITAFSKTQFEGVRHFTALSFESTAQSNGDGRVVTYFEAHPIFVKDVTPRVTITPLIDNTPVPLAVLEVNCMEEKTPPTLAELQGKFENYDILLGTTAELKWGPLTYPPGLTDKAYGKEEISVSSDVSLLRSSFTGSTQYSYDVTVTLEGTLHGPPYPSVNAGFMEGYKVKATYVIRVFSPPFDPPSVSAKCPASVYEYDNFDVKLTIKNTNRYKETLDNVEAMLYKEGVEIRREGFGDIKSDEAKETSWTLSLPQGEHKCVYCVTYRGNKLGAYRTGVVKISVAPKPAEKGKDCLIATAAYGSELAPEVQFLRGFRNGILLPTFAGNQFTRFFNAWYYSFSPFAARIIAEQPTLKALTIIALYPLAATFHLAELTYNMFCSSPELGVAMALLVASCLIGIVYFLPVTWMAIAVVRHLRKSGEESGSSYRFGKLSAICYNSDKHPLRMLGRTSHTASR